MEDYLHACLKAEPILAAAAAAATAAADVQAAALAQVGWSLQIEASTTYELTFTRPEFSAFQNHMCSETYHRCV